MHRPRVTILFAAVLVVLASVLGAGAGVGIAVADDGEEPFFDGLITDDGRDGYLASAGVWLADATAGATRYWTAVMADEDASAQTYAQNFTSTFNANNETIAQYASKRLEADTSHDVFAVYFHDRDGNNVTRYVVSDVQNGNWTNVTVLTPSEFEDTNRTADHWVSLDWYQSRNADDELSQFVEEYAEPGRNLSATYKAQLLATYGAPESDMWNTTEDD